MTTVRPSRFFLFLLTGGALLLGCDSGGDAMSEPPPVTEEGWRRVEGVPASFMETMLVAGDTLYVAGQERVYVTQGTGGWTALAPVPNGYEIATLLRTDGRLFAGTYQGGVFEATGASTGWREWNEGLQGAGATTVLAMAARGGSLVVGTDGASLFRRSLTDPGASWQPFRTGIPSNIAWNTSALSRVGGRLVAGAGANGVVYLNERDDEFWRGVSYDPNLGTFLQMDDLLDTGTSLLGGGTERLYRSTDAGETWQSYDLTVGGLGRVRFARVGDVLVALAAKPSGMSLYVSVDDGRTWRRGDEGPGVQAFDVAIYDHRLYLARADGLWARPTSEVLD